MTARRMILPAALVVLAMLGAGAAMAQVTRIEGYGVQRGGVQQPGAQPVAQQQAQPAGQQAPGGFQQPGMQPGQPAATRPSAPAPMPSPKVDLVNEAIDRTAPLTPEDIMRLRRELEQRAAALNQNASGKPPPRPLHAIYHLDLSPNRDVSPPVVRVSLGQGAVVSFLDSTGKPWPFKLADNYGEERGIGMSRFSDHQISVWQKFPGAMGSVSVALDGIPTAVTFTVVAEQNETDHHVQMIVPRFKDGPPANVISQGSIPAVGTADLYDYLLRTPPKGARKLTVSGASGATAWQTSTSKMVVRTEALLTSAIRYFSLDGVGVYEVPLSPLVMGMLNGRYVELRVSGFTSGGMN